MRKAIILSAGQGKRLLPLTETIPKCLLTLSGPTMLEWQLRALAANGVAEVVVVIGFGADAVEHSLRGLQLPGMNVRTLYNPFYGVADNIGTCFVALPEMAGDFLILNGDTLFEPRLLAKVISEADGPVSITIDRKPSYDADDMKVQSDGNRLLAVDKALPLETVDGESIGLLAFRQNGGALFADTLNAVIREPNGVRRWYLSVIDRMARAGHVRTVSIEGMEWGEVDFPVDRERAEVMTKRWRDSARFDLSDAAQ